MAGRGPDFAGMLPEDWHKLRDKEVHKLRRLRREDGKMPGLALARAASLLDRSEDQVRRYVDKGDPDPPSKVSVFVFTAWYITLANGYGGKIKQLHDDLRLHTDLLLLHGIVIPAAYLTFWRAWNRLSKERKLYAKQGIKAHRKLRLRVPWEAPHRNAAWQVDVCRLDIWVVPNGGTKPVRPWLIAVIDDNTRMLLAWRLTLHSPTGADVQCVLAAAMMRRCRDGHWYGGRPSAIRWDNGNEFLNNNVTLFAMRIRFDAYAVAPYHPEAKGKIERFFRTLQESWLERLPGYSKGPRAKDKKEVYWGPTKDLYTFDKLVAYLRKCCDNYNFSRPHGGINDHIPFEKWCADETPLTWVSRAKLSAYFLPLDGRTRKISTKGIQYANKHYTCYELPEGRHESDLINKQVTLRGVPHETSWVDVHGEDGRFLCTARPVSSLATEEIVRHGMRRDADQRKCDSDLREGAALRLEAAALQDPETGGIATVVQVALAGLETASGNMAAADPVPAQQEPMAQLIPLTRATIPGSINASRQKARRRRGPRRPPQPPQDTTLPLEA